jgi:N-methylhydantoinase B
MDRSEAAARARTRSIPDGVYEAESFMDDDGISVGKRIPIKVRVVVKGEEMTIDLTEVSRQVRGFYNSGVTTGYACTQVAYKCLTSPTDYPINDGSFRSLKSIVPSGRVVSATRPAPMRYWMTFPMTIVDTVFKALAPAIPDRVIAGHHADLVIAQFHGINPRNSEFFIGNFGPQGGGWGAKRREDGVSGTVCINDGDTHNGPNEQVEAKFPIVVERYALVPDSGGAGRHRGGLGLERVVRARSDITLNTQSERAHCRPWGLDGGLEATGNAVALRFGGAWKTDFPNAKVLVAQIKTGDAFRLRSGGGGGYGSPLARPIEDVANDVRQGYVSVAAAAELYGVVIDPETFAVDAAASARLRARA